MTAAKTSLFGVAVGSMFLAMLCGCGGSEEDPHADAGAGGSTSTGSDHPSGATSGYGGAGSGGAPSSGGAGGSSTSARPLEGFGADTVGGAGQPVCTVTTLADSGTGSLRDCLSGSQRFIEFGVGGTIELATSLRMEGLSDITIDGSTAPAPGITITAGGAGVENALFIVTDASHDLIFRHLRFRDATDTETGDTFRLYSGTHRVVVDHCSFRRGADGGFDITGGVHDVTVQWCIIGQTIKNQLISYDVSNVSLHHNLYVDGTERNPQLDTATSIDLVNNVIYGWGGNYGTRIRDASSANLVKNIYLPGPGSDSADAVIIDAASGAQVYSEGNVIPDAADDTGTLESRIAAPPVLELVPSDALAAVLAEAGAFPRDEEDAGYVAKVAQ